MKAGVYRWGAQFNRSYNIGTRPFVYKM